jgi:hypothetical protein
MITVANLRELSDAQLDAMLRGDGFLYIGRAAFYRGRRLPASPFANPHVLGRAGDRMTVISRFERETMPFLHQRMIDEIASRPNLVLVCWCAPQRCHGHSIALNVNAYLLIMKRTDGVIASDGPDTPFKLHSVDKEER